MAGAAVLSAFMQVVFEKLSAAAIDELGIFRAARGVHKELNSLSSTMSSIKALVEDAEEKQMKDKLVRNWLLKLKDVAYEIDELIDDYAAGDPESKFREPNLGQWIKVWKHLRCFCLSNGLFKHEIANQIREINLRLDKLAKERDCLGLQMFGGTDRLEYTERPKTGSLVDNSSILGREDDKEKIIKFMLSRSSSITVIAIVGMGGLGKTTLAQVVYNEARIKEHFEVRIWVCVSENFDVLKLTKEAIESVSVTNLSTTTTVNYTTNMNLLQEDLCNKLKGKRFLLVLDDVWNEDSNKWESYYRALAVGERGSTIIVTTRNESVGRMMQATLSYKLKQLSDEDCWKLFKNYAFVNGDISSHPNLEKLGKEIVRKLKGLPLAAKTLGSLLYSKLEEEDWRSIAKSEIWELPVEKNSILPALKLSYKHLPPHLKQCFAFCSIFHKDYVFEKDKLVYIWIALGFIEPQSRRRLENVGNSYFDDLLGRSFFQTHKGRFVMHDAIHDLAQSISADECLRLDIGGFDSVVHIDKEFLGSGEEAGFPSLTELALQDMSSLQDWVNDNNVDYLPCLNELQLLLCPKLQRLPLLPPNLTRIQISESGFNILPQLYTSSSMPKPSLTSLQIHDCPSLTSLQHGLLEQRLEFLEELTITDCESLVRFPVTGFLHFRSLKILHIYNCPELVPMEGTLLLPPFLDDLRITKCNKVINTILREIKHVPSLTHLMI